MAPPTLGSEDLALELEKLATARPHLQTLVKAFGPLILEKAQWLADTAVDRPTVAIDAERLAAGIAVGQQMSLFAVGDPWGSAGWSVAKAITEGFPAFGGDMEILLRCFTEGNYDFFGQFFAAADDDAEREFDRQARELGVTPMSLHFFLRSLHRYMLAKKARDLKPLLEGLSWKKGYCPICAALPCVAIIGENGQRSLHCADCGHSWPFPRLTCPSCEYEDPQNSNLLFIDECKEEAAFFCEKCHGYLLTATRSAHIAPFHPDLVALGMVHLDLIMQEKGYAPMARSEWNGFDKAGEAAQD